MASQNNKAPFRSPTWLSDAARKRAGPPPQAFLDRLKFVREHPVEFQKELREKAVQAGQDPDTFAKSMAEQNKTTGTVSLNLLPQDASTSASKEPCAASVNTSATSGPDVLLWSWRPSPQPRLGTKGQITKLPQRKSDARGRGTSSASSTASPMDIDQPYPLAESSATGAARIPEGAGSSETDAATQHTAQPYAFPARSRLPGWHDSISHQKLMLLERKRPQEFVAIDALKACIGRCEKNGLPKDIKDLRDHVHEAEIMLKMDRVLVRKTRILTEDGLPRIFGEAADFRRQRTRGKRADPVGLGDARRADAEQSARADQDSPARRLDAARPRHLRAGQLRQ